MHTRKKLLSWLLVLCLTLTMLPTAVLAAAGTATRDILSSLEGIKDSVDYYKDHSSQPGELDPVDFYTSPAEVAEVIAAELPADELKDALLSESSDDGEVTKKFTALDEAVKAAYGIELMIAPTHPDFTCVSIVGAALNASEPTVSLTVGEAQNPSRPIPTGYSSEKAVRFSMDLHGVSDPGNLKVPVMISLVIPSVFTDASKIVVLHYHGNSTTPDVLTPKSTTGDQVVIVLTGFSDFIMTETTETPAAPGTEVPGTTPAVPGTEDPGTGNRPTTGGSSSSSDPGPTYSVNTSRADHGSISVSPENATAGTKVTITVRPDAGYELDTLTVLNKGGREVRLTSAGDGKYTFIMPGSDAEIRVTFKEASVVTNTPALSSFTDVPANHWAVTEITWALQKGVMNGTGNGAFSPNGTVTRQQLWMVLARLSGNNPADMAAARAWAMSNGISDGSTSTGAVTRQQMTAILYRYAQLMNRSTSGGASLSSYPDSGSVSSYATDAMAWAVGNGIVNGTTDGRLNPGGNATRAQFAVILYRFAQKLNF